MQPKYNLPNWVTVGQLISLAANYAPGRYWWVIDDGQTTGHSYSEAQSLASLERATENRPAGRWVHGQYPESERAQ
jgi:hypothetical protein